MLLLRHSVCTFAFGLAMLVAGSAFGQTYPTKPIRVLTSEPGGGGDIAMRMIAPDLTAGLGRPVVIDNRPLAMSGEVVARAAPDGYTLTVYAQTLWLGPLMQPMRYDPLKDFAPVTMLTRSPNLVLVHPSLPVNSIKELIAYAKSKPGVLNYSSGNSGSTSHLAMELFKSMAGLDIVRIPFKGGAGPAVNALLAGETQVMVSSANSASPNVRSRVKALAVTTPQRSVLIPDLPTVAESGLPGYDSATYFGMVTTAGTPRAIVARLNREVVRVLNKKEIQEQFLKSGVESAGTSPEQFGEMLRSEMARMGKVIKDAGIRAE